jgi:hypothetical protein
MSGKMHVGNIFRQEPTSATTLHWFWTINGVQRTSGDVMQVAGRTASLDEAKAAIADNWQKWLAWANLRDAAEAAAPGPGLVPDQSPRGS